MQWRGAAAAFVGPSNCFAIDCHHTGELDPIGFGKCGHKASEGSLESLRIERVEDSAKRVVTGDSAWQAKELPQQLFFGGCNPLHIRRPSSSAQYGGQCDDHDVQQVVQRVGRAWIGQGTEHLANFVHRTPFAYWESLFSIHIASPCNTALISIYGYSPPLKGEGRLPH